MNKSTTQFVRQNAEWGADPNVPRPEVMIDGSDVVLDFRVSYFGSHLFGVDDLGLIRFHNCSRFRVTSLNDEGWYLGQCRFSDIAPEWGEFYEVVGDFKEDECDCAWTSMSEQMSSQRNFLFYFRDETFECSAERWSFEPSPDNALAKKALTASKSGPKRDGNPSP